MTDAELAAIRERRDRPPYLAGDPVAYVRAGKLRSYQADIDALLAEVERLRAADCLDNDCGCRWYHPLPKDGASVAPSLPRENDPGDYAEDSER